MMRWLLFASLALNLLLIGAAVGVGLGEMRQQKTRETAAIARQPSMRAIVESLPPERAAAVQAKVADAWRAAKEERREARAANLEVARIVAAETYDRAAADAALARMRAANAKVAARFHDVVSAAMADMTVEERRALLRGLARRAADGAHDGGAELRRTLKAMPPEERRALLREALEERREALKDETPEARRERLKAMREAWRRRRAEEAPAQDAPSPP